jgi:ketosteroid isomerase-like protein
MAPDLKKILIMNTNVVLDFADAISNADVDKIYSLMAEDHLFIDSQDNRVLGKENMKQAWIGYFALFPDYKIEINEILEKDSLICAIGYASGTYKNLKNKNNSNHWRIPAAWSAIVKDNKIKVWQVYADNIIVMKIINENE